MSLYADENFPPKELLSNAGLWFEEYRSHKEAQETQEAHRILRTHFVHFVAMNPILGQSLVALIWPES